MRVAVAGGTGVVGRHVVRSVEQAGHTPVVLTRSQGVDLTTGAGLDAALDGVDAVIDVSNASTVSGAKAVAFFGGVTEHLLEAGRRAGVGHLVALSIVNSDKVDLGYYLGKRRQEELLASGQVPATVLRSTQFHEFAELFLQRSTGPVSFVPRMRIAPVAAQEVAAALVRIAEQAPVGRAPDLAGPESHGLPDLVRRLARARGRRAWVVPIRVLGQAGRQMARGDLLPDVGAERGTQTFDAWLAATP
jgi:uncharacterized protein YbjT (DUF2867 family)